MRRILLVLVVVGVMILGAAAPAGAVPAPSPYSFPDAQGDPTNGAARGDIVRVGIRHSTTVKLTVSMVRAIPFSQWAYGTTNGLFNMQVHINGTTFTNLYVTVTKVSAVLADGESTLPCAVTRRANTTSDRYTFTFPRSCIGSPASIGVQVLVGMRNPTPAIVDTAPNRRTPTGFSFSRRVAFAP